MKIIDFDAILLDLITDDYTSKDGKPLGDSESFISIATALQGSYPLMFLPHEAAPVVSVIDELNRAEELHPEWPTDGYKGLAVISEEHGELAQAILQFEMEGADPENIRNEAIQLAAVALRFVMNLPAKKIINGRKK